MLLPETRKVIESRIKSSTIYLRPSILGQNPPENQEKSNNEIDDLINKIMGENTKT